MAPDESPVELSRRLVYLAAERTLTSWLRTALSLMALGFVVDRFDLVLRQLTDTAVSPATPRTSWWLTGSIMVGLGVAMAVVSGAYYLRFARRYRRSGTTDVGTSLVVGSVFAMGLGALGLLVLCVLVLTLR
jgi:putative membrane protein